MLRVAVERIVVAQWLLAEQWKAGLGCCCVRALLGLQLLYLGFLQPSDVLLDCSGRSVCVCVSGTAVQQLRAVACCVGVYMEHAWCVRCYVIL